MVVTARGMRAVAAVGRHGLERSMGVSAATSSGWHASRVVASGREGGAVAMRSYGSDAHGSDLLPVGHRHRCRLLDRCSHSRRLASTQADHLEKEGISPETEDTVAQPGKQGETAEASGKAPQTLGKESDQLQDQKGSDEGVKEKEIAKFKDAYMRTLADMENLRVQTKREITQKTSNANLKLAKDLISVLDVIGLALKSVPQEGLANEASKDLKNLFQGVTMMEKEFMKVLQNHGVERFDPTGEKFDPNTHEALYQAPVPGKEPGTVLACETHGYRLRGTLLRPAKVGVVADA